MRIDIRRQANKNPSRKMPVGSVPGGTDIYNEWMNDTTKIEWIRVNSEVG